jgi:hypothetical protein
MPAAIDPAIKKPVIAQYLQGVSRDRIAADNGIGTGTVSNIIDEWKKGAKSFHLLPRLFFPLALVSALYSLVLIRYFLS